MQSRPYAKISIVSLALSLTFAGCGGSGSVPSATSAVPQAPSPAVQALQPDKASTAALYVSDSYGKSVFRFVRRSDGTLQTPAGSSLVLPYNPGPIAIANNGNLFVTDEQNESIEIYHKGATGSAQPSRTLLLPFVPSCVAVDAKGYEYAGGFSNGHIAV